MTISGQVVGTPAYMAPEQVQGDPARVDRRVDVYAIGATLYDLVAGRAPFLGSTRMETLIKVVTDEPPPLRQLDGSVPADLEASKGALQFFDWAYMNGDEMAEELDYIPMPSNVVELVREEWKTIKDDKGNPVFAMN